MNLIPVSKLVLRLILMLMVILFFNYLGLFHVSYGFIQNFKLYNSQANYKRNYYNGNYIRNNSTGSSNEILLKNWSIDCKTTGEKWIVITTIHDPSEPIKRMLNFKEWNMVIIGDRKTPATWDSFINSSSLVFLSLIEQTKLPFKIVKYIPENNYARKNIGYLYAISCGAKIIYETDDDNQLKSQFTSVPLFQKTIKEGRILQAV